MFDTILVPVDGEEPATSALRLAARMAAQDGARLVILYAPPVEAPPEQLREMAEHLGFLEAIRDDLEAIEAVPTVATVAPAVPALQYPEGFHTKWGELVLDWARSVAHGEGAQRTEGVLAEGDAADAVCEQARSKQAGLIVMGSHGRGKLGGLLFGSVSQKVLHECECPCMIVK